MTNRKKIPLVLLLSVLLLQIEALAQRNQRSMQPVRTGWTSASTPNPTATPELNAEVKQVKESVAEALGVIRKNYIAGKQLNYNDVFKSSIDRMLRTLDPYSTYFDAKEMALLNSDKSGSNFDIGVTIGDPKIGDETGIFVLASSQNSPAANADLRFGDKIVQVGNWDVKGHSAAKVGTSLRGGFGSRVKLTLERAADGQRQTVELKRDLIQKPYLPDAYMIRPGIGYIQMTRGFGVSTAEHLDERLTRLRNDGMTSLVLDLRDNTGGLLMQAISISNHFLSRGQLILLQKGGRMKNSDNEFTAINDNPDKSPLVVLVNRKTASGAEIVAGALQDHDRALIVGENTVGQGLGQLVFPLEYGSLLLTISKFYTPSGRATQRDSSGGYYYYPRRSPFERSDEDVATNERPAGSEHKTDTGRSVYSGGIAPDEEVKPRSASRVQKRLIDPVFGFVRELVNARVVGFESYAVRRPVNFTHVPTADEFAVTDKLFNAFKQFVAKTPSYQLTEKQLDANRDFIALQLRHDMVTAAYGPLTAARVLKAHDPQVLQAIDALPRAAALAAAPRNR